MNQVDINQSKSCEINKICVAFFSTAYSVIIIYTLMCL